MQMQIYKSQSVGVTGKHGHNQINDRHNIIREVKVDINTDKMSCDFQNYILNMLNRV